MQEFGSPKSIFVVSYLKSKLKKDDLSEKNRIVAVLFISANLYSQDMLKHVAGKWNIDIEATKKIPEVAESLKDPKNEQMFNFMMGMLGKAVFEFGPDSLTTTIEMEGPDGKKEQTQTKKFTVVKNTKDELIIADDKKKELLITKSGDNIVLKEVKKDDEKEGPQGTQAMAFKRAK